MTPHDFWDACDQLCREYSVWQTSGRRTDSHAVAIGGFSGDPHTWGAGVDVANVRPAEKDWFASRARALGVKAIFEVDHIHLQPWDWPAGPVTAAPDPSWAGMHV